MHWNWEQSDWPDFSWNKVLLEKAEESFLVGSGVLVGALRHLYGDARQQFEIEAICTEALTTSEIEGEFLDRSSVQSSIRQAFGLVTDEGIAGPADRGIAEQMVDLYRSFAEPLSHDTLFRWHRMLMAGRQDLGVIGGYRVGKEPMQVISGPVHSPRVHFEAPPASEVPQEMDRFVGWFNRTATDTGDALPCLTRAGVAHIYFESIHPFEDGNGRIGRAVSEKALAQGLQRPTLVALAATILLRRKAYYAALGAAGMNNELSAWLAWFAGIAIEAQRRTEARVGFLIDKIRLLDGLRGRLNERQEKALLRVLREGPDGFAGGLSAGNYMTITGASPATSTRDLADMVAKGALTRTGERRHARYYPTVPLRPVGAVTVGPNGELHEKAAPGNRSGVP